MTDPNNGAVPPIPPPGGYSNQPPASAPNNPYQTPSSQQSNPYQAPSSAPNSPYGAPPRYSDDTTPPKTLSLIGMISGIIGVIAFGLFVPASIAALVLGYLGRKREGEPAKGFWLTAIITGWVGVALSVIVALGFIALIALGSAVSTTEGF